MHFNVDEDLILALTQTITNSYDDQEPAQPMKVWNKNNDANSSFCFHCRKSSSKFFYLDSTDVIPKQNGINDSPNKSSSSFVSHPPVASTADDDDDDDKDLIIGSTALPEAVPLVSELNESSKEMEDTPPSVNEQMTTETPKAADEDENMTDTATNDEIVKEPAVEEQMDTDQANGKH
jgi:hypothetical protein